MRIAILGGTGDMGSALAWRWARSGYPVIIGSRSPERADLAASLIRQRLPGGADLRGADNVTAARECDIAVLTVPFEQQEEMLKSVRDALTGKLLVSATVPLRPPKIAVVELPPVGSAAVAAQAVVGSEVRVVSAFQTVAASWLEQDRPIDSDVLVAGDKPEDRDLAIELVEALGMRGLHAGPLANSAASEALTSVLIHINRRYKIEGAGLRITGLDHPPR